MNIDSIHLTQHLRADLTDAPNMQMSTHTAWLTLNPHRALLLIEDGVFVSITFEAYPDFHAGRRFAADDTVMPNWVRVLIEDVLDPKVVWPMRGERAVEYVINRDVPGKGELALALVDPNEVAGFLRVRRENSKTRDFTITREGDETMTGDVWLAAHKTKADA